MARSHNFYILMFPLYCQVFAIATLSVIQTPNLSVPKGANASISCSWEAEDRDERIRVWWKIYYESASTAHNGTILASLMWTNNKSEVRTRSRDHSDYQLTKDKANLLLFYVNESDAGTYICEITIDKPELRSGKGNGTTLYVTGSLFSNGSSTTPGKIAYLAVFIILISVILLGYFLYKRRKKESIHILNQRAPEAVQLNEMHENMNDGEDSSSSNSVKWAVSTLYESCDYFAMKTPETPEDAVYSLAT